MVDGFQPDLLGSLVGSQAAPGETPPYIYGVIRWCCLTFRSGILGSTEPPCWRIKKGNRSYLKCHTLYDRPLGWVYPLNHFNEFLEDFPFPNTCLTEHLTLGIVS